MISPEEKKEIDEALGIVASKRSAGIEALQIAQKYRGWVSDETLKEVADYLEMSVHELDSISSFYNLLFRHPVGKHIIFICDSVSCWITGYDKIIEHLQNTLAISPGGTTEDGEFTLLTIPCLGLCDEAPAMIIDTTSYTKLTPEKIDQILNEIKGRY